MELKANELRIGNYLNTIHGIKRVSDISVDRYCWFTDNQCEPIPLTEEWLFKFGFEKINRNFLLEFYNNGCFFYDLNKKEFWIGGYDSCASSQGFTVDNIEFVHQLQNIIFTLINKELKIKM